jgi:hypothetical protein
MTGWPRFLKGRHNPSLMPLDDALEALGDNGDMGRRTAEVPIANIVGSAGRATDFNHELRLVNKALQDRWNRLYRAMESGFEPPAVHLVQLGELYFIIDGHHRVSVARALGRLVIAARVHRICTIAYAKSCLRVAHLPTKAAERGFLERVPLPSEIREGLWLDEPAQWTRLADAAEAWGLRRSLERGHALPRDALAATWWTEEVEPLVARLRAAGIGMDLRDVQLYVTALAVRDRLGASSWPADIVERLPTADEAVAALR